MRGKTQDTHTLYMEKLRERTEREREKGEGEGETYTVQKHIEIQSK